jgi:hypothetical protein
MQQRTQSEQAILSRLRRKIARSVAVCETSEPRRTRTGRVTRAAASATSTRRARGSSSSLLLVIALSVMCNSNSPQAQESEIVQAMVGTTVPKWADVYADLDTLYPTHPTAAHQTSAVIIRNRTTENDGGGGLFRWIVGMETSPSERHAQIRGNA